MNLENIPRYMPLDFLLTILGIIISFATFYFYFIEDKSIIVGIFFLIGLLIFFTGIMLMLENYFMEREVKILKFNIEKIELTKKLKDLEITN